MLLRVRRAGHRARITGYRPSSRLAHDSLVRPCLCDPEQADAERQLRLAAGRRFSAGGTLVNDIRPGKVFRDARPPRNRWRVVGQSNGVAKLVSLERPNIMRFQSSERLLDPHLYRPEEEQGD